MSDTQFDENIDNQRFDIETKMEVLRNEIHNAGGDIWFLSLGAGSVVQDKRFTGVVVATPFGRGVILANTVIDSTGNSVIPHCAGLPTQMINNEHISVQGTGLPPWVPGENFQNSDWTFAHDDDALDVWRMHVVSRRKNSGKYDDGQLVDSRARRRIYGDVFITPMDILNQRVFPDVITVAQSDFDNHGFSSHNLFMVFRQDRTTLYGNVPYRALLPKEYDGILVTGLGISAHGDAMPVIRMQRDVENHSYAAGWASAMAAMNQTTVRNIDVAELQRHLADVGVIPETMVGAQDSYPFSQETIAAAVNTLGQDYTGIAQILTQPETAIPLMRTAYQEATDEAVKRRYAHVLGLLYDDIGAETLINAVAQATDWDAGWKFKGCGNFGPTTSPLDNLIIALGRTKDERALPVLIEKAAQLTDESELSHFRAISVAFENIGDYQAAPALARLMQLESTSGNAFLNIDDVLSGTPASIYDCTTREVSLRELFAARALYRSGDYERIGRNTLEEYSNDMRGYYAIHARAVLAENVPEGPYSEEAIPFSGVDEALNPETGVLTLGTERCTDSSYVITAIPDELKGTHFLTVARGDASEPGTGYEFTAEKAGTLYLLVHDRGSLPEIEGWTKTSLSVSWEVGTWKFDDIVYSKTVSAGETVIVPAHTGKENHYGVPHMVLHRRAKAKGTTILLTRKVIPRHPVSACLLTAFCVAPLRAGCLQ